MEDCRNIYGGMQTTFLTESGCFATINKKCMNTSTLSTSMIQKFDTLRWTALDWLFPPQCVGCGSPGSAWCVNCLCEVKTLQTRVCPLCGTPQRNVRLCADCRQEEPAFDWVRSWGEYDGVLKKAIHRLKYGNDISLARYFAIPLLRLYSTCDTTADLAAVVPISRQRMRTRGYNQALLIARAFCLIADLPLRPQAIRRLRQTETQVGKNRLERWQNVQDAFEADKKLVEGKTVLVIDDVFTTGATLRACAHALKYAGASKVIALTAARAGLLQDEPMTPEDWQAF